MSDNPPTTPRKSVLDPVERLSEVLFGLIMALTFTGSLSVASAGRGDVREMLVGAIGCNIAWGLIDAIMYLMACLNARGLDLKAITAMRSARSKEQAHAVIREKVPEVVADELDHHVLERIRARVAGMPDVPAWPRLRRDDLRGALGVFLLVVAATMPVVLPFVFIGDVHLAMRVSNAVAIAMLAVIGHAYGRASGLPPLWTAGAMVLLGSLLVAITILLGG